VTWAAPIGTSWDKEQLPCVSRTELSIHPVEFKRQA